MVAIRTVKLLEVKVLVVYVPMQGCALHPCGAFVPSTLHLMRGPRLGVMYFPEMCPNVFGLHDLTTARDTASDRHRHPAEVAVRVVARPERRYIDLV